MGKNATNVNGRSPVTKGSGGVVTVFPDVCKTPSPGGPVPVPYPNVAKSGDLADGSKNTTIEGNPVCLKDQSTFSTSTGDEGGTAGGGIVSGKTKGKSKPLAGSANVKIEGKGPVRNFDVFISNDGNTPPAPVTQPQQAAASTGPNEPCVLCGKNHPGAKKDKIEPSHWHHGGMTGKLEPVLGKLGIYPSFPPPYKVEGHHSLAFSAFVQNKKDAFPILNHYLKKAGYTPNRLQNCIQLPGRPDYAAFWTSIDLGKPLQMHIGDHDEQFFTQCRNLLSQIMANLMEGEPCEEIKEDDLPKELLQEVTYGENAAFTRLASCAPGWELHPDHGPFAIRMYAEPTTMTAKNPRGRPTAGHGGSKAAAQFTYPKPDLETGIY